MRALASIHRRLGGRHTVLRGSRLFSEVAKAEKPAAAAAAPPPPPPPPAAPQVIHVKSPGDGWRGRFSSFAVGVALTTLFGYVKIREDIMASFQELDSKLERIQEPIDKLESRVSNLEKN